MDTSQEVFTVDLSTLTAEQLQAVLGKLIDSDKKTKKTSSTSTTTSSTTPTTTSSSTSSTTTSSTIATTTTSPTARTTTSPTATTSSSTVTTSKKCEQDQCVPVDEDDASIEELLINEIKSYSCIWDVLARGYKDQMKTRTAWKNIATKLGKEGTCNL